MRAFIKTQWASAIASCVDFGITVACREALGFWVMAATIIGTICGGVVNFLLGRQWVFKGKGISIHRQASRYSLVWSGNFLLNVSGVFVMTGYLHANYILSKVFVSIVIGCTYNYLLQKEYVFR